MSEQLITIIVIIAFLLICAICFFISDLFDALALIVIDLLFNTRNLIDTFKEKGFWKAIKHYIKEARDDPRF